MKKFRSFLERNRAAVSSLTLIAFVSNGIAQISPSSDPNFAPTVGTAGNGRTPVVNIVAPKAGGVSHNKYQSFNVTADGVILNNSKSAGTSQTGGAVSANPNLSGAAARVIVNEVESGGSRSQIKGTTEVFGQSADVIIANPNGVTVNGGKFINSPRVTISTGTAHLNAAGQVELDVNQGDVAVEGAGLAAANVSEVNVVGKRVKVDGKIRAGDRLDVLAGTRRYNQATRQSTGTGVTDSGYGIDASDLGAMQAGKITLQSADRGVGVRTAGNLAATSGDLVIGADGNLRVGSANSTQTAAGAVKLTSAAGRIDHAGRTKATAPVELKAKAITVESNSVVESETRLLVEAPEIIVEFEGWLNSTGPIEVKAFGPGSRIIMDGALNTDLDLLVNTNGDYFQGGIAHAGRDAIINAERAHFTGTGMNVDAGRDIIGNVSDWLNAGDLDAHRDILLFGDTIKSTGNIRAREHLRFDAITRVTNEGTLSAPDINFAGPAPLYNNNGGSLIGGPDSAPIIHLPSGGLDNNGGNFFWNGDLNWSPAFLRLGNGTFEVLGSMTLTIAGDFENAGKLTTGGPMSFTVGGNWTNSGEIIAGSGGLTVSALGAVRNLPGGKLTFVDFVELSAGSFIEQIGTILSGGYVALQSGGDLLWAGDLVTGGELGVVTAGDLTMTGGTAVAVGEVIIGAAGNVRLDGQVLADAGLVISAGDGFEQGVDGILASEEEFRLDIAGGDSFLEGEIHSGGDLILTSYGLVRQGADAVWTAEETIQVELGGKWTGEGQIRGLGAITLLAKGDLEQTAGSLLATGGELTLTTREGDLILDGEIQSIGSVFLLAEEGSLSQGTTGKIEAEGDLAAHAAVDLSLDGTNSILGTALLVGEDWVNVGGSLAAVGPVEILSAMDVWLSGAITVGGDISVSAGDVLWQLSGSNVRSESDVMLQSDGVTFLDGEIVANGVILAQAKSGLEVAGTLSALNGIRLEVTDGNLAVSGRVVSGNDLAVTAATGRIALAAGSALETRGNLLLEGKLDIVALGLVRAEESAKFVSTADGVVLGPSFIGVLGGDAQISAALGVVLGGYLRSGGNLEANAHGGLIQQLGYVAVDGDVQLSAALGISTAGWIGAGGILEIESYGAYGNSGFVGAEQGMSIQAWGAMQNVGLIHSGGNLILNTFIGGLSSSGSILVRENLMGNVAGAFSQDGGTLAVGGDLNLNVASSVTNRLSTISAGRDMLLIAGGWISNFGARVLAGRDAILRGVGMSNVTTDGIYYENGQPWEHPMDRYMTTYFDDQVHSATIGGNPAAWMEIAVMGYSATQRYVGQESLVSVGRNLTIDVGSGSNEASVIIAGGKANLHGTWQNKSEYRVFADSWVAMDHAVVLLNGDEKDKMKDREYDFLGGWMVWEDTPEIAGNLDTNSHIWRMDVFHYVENILGIHPDGGGTSTGWIAMGAGVAIGNPESIDKSYERFRLVNNYRDDIIWRRAIIQGNGGTNVTIANDDYGVSWAGQGGGSVTGPLGVGGAGTGLGGGYQVTVDAAAVVGTISASAALGTLDALASVGAVDSASWVKRPDWENRIPTASNVSPVFTLAGYTAYPVLPPSVGVSSNPVAVTPTPSVKKIPSQFFNFIPDVLDTGYGTLPDPYKDGQGLTGVGDGNEAAGSPAEVTTSETLRQQLTDLKADNEKAAAGLGIGLEANDFVVTASDKREAFAQMSAEGVFAGGSLAAAAGKMLHEATVGVNILEKLEVPDLASVIKERSERYLEEENQIKALRKAYIKELMEQGYSRADAEKKALAKYGEGYFERIKRISKEQDERLWQILNPPPANPFGGMLGILGLIVGAVLTLVLSIYTLGAASVVLASLWTMLAGSVAAAGSAAAMGITVAAGVISGAIAGAAGSFVGTMIGTAGDVNTAAKAALVAAIVGGITGGVLRLPMMDAILLNVAKVLEPAFALVKGTTEKALEAAAEFLSKLAGKAVGDLASMAANQLVYGNSGASASSFLKSMALAGVTALASFVIGHMGPLEDLWDNGGPKLPGSNITLAEQFIKPFLHGAASYGIGTAFGEEDPIAMGIGAATGSFASPWVDWAMGSIGSYVAPQYSLLTHTQATNLNSQISSWIGGFASLAANRDFYAGAFAASQVYEYNEKLAAGVTSSYQDQIRDNVEVMKLLQARVELIEEHALLNNVDPNLLRAIIVHESRGFRDTWQRIEAQISWIRSGYGGSYGYAQLGPDARRGANLSIEVAQTMSGSIRGAAKWLAISKAQLQAAGISNPSLAQIASQYNYSGQLGLVSKYGNQVEWTYKGIKNGTIFKYEK